jgi:BON domain
MKNISMRRAAMGAALTSALVILPGLAWAGQSHRESAGRERRPGSYLVREVGHALRLLPYYTVFDNLEYKVEGYNVELDGAVTRPVLKSDAEDTVKRIEGVRRVTNKIKVLPPSPADDHIRWAEYRAIFGFAPLERYAIQAVPPIHIIVDAGRVSLEGVVANKADKNMAGIRANTVPGVFSVTNNLRVEK